MAEELGNFIKACTLELLLTTVELSSYFALVAPLTVLKSPLIASFVWLRLSEVIGRLWLLA